MCSNRCNGSNGSNGSNNNDQVQGISRIPVIAIRGPGCINGTGRCDGVLGTGGQSNNSNNVMGSGGRRRNRNCDRCCQCIWDYLETPTIVPR